MSRMICVLFVLLCMVFSAYAQDELGVDVDFTYATKYIWRGFDLFDDKAALHPSVNLDLWGSGFEAGWWAAYPASAGTGTDQFGDTFSRVDATEFDYYISYSTTLFADEACATDVTAIYTYYDYIDTSTRGADSMEYGLNFQWPNICPAGFVPSYYVGFTHAAKSNSELDPDYAGWVHVIGIGYDLMVPGIDTAEQLIALTASITYNDGFTGGDVDHDWSHATFGAAAPIGFGNMSFTPAIYWQQSFEDTVNRENELYATFSVGLSF